MIGGTALPDRPVSAQEGEKGKRKMPPEGLLKYRFIVELAMMVTVLLML